ncbi:MAG: helix-turn-helix transcriptional regulator [Pseudomonadota bacterium]
MNSTIDGHLGQRIAEARERVGMLAPAAADELGLSVSAYQALERGERRVSALILSKISRLYGLPIGWFYEGLPGQSAFAHSAKPSSI